MTNKSFKYIYEEISDFILVRIKNGTYPMGSRIPSENEFSKVFGVHRKTVRTSISKLTDEGYLKTIPGKGTYVVGEDKDIELFEKYRVNSERLEQRDSEVVRAVVREVGDFYKNIFNCDSSDLMYSIGLVYQQNDIPSIYELIYIPERIIPNIDKYDLKAFNAKEIFAFENIKIDKIEQVLKTVDISTRNSKYLSVKPLEKVLKLERISYDENGECVEYREKFIRGDIMHITNKFGGEIWK